MNVRTLGVSVRASLLALLLTVAVSAFADDRRVDLSSIPRGLGDRNGDGRNQRQGNVILVQAPSVELDPASEQAQRLGSTTQQVVTRLHWNDKGQVTRTTDPEGVVTEYQYHPEDQPDSQGLEQGFGYLKLVTVDPTDLLPPVSGVTHLGLTTRYRYDQVGNLISVTNARGTTTAFEVNALDRRQLKLPVADD